MSTTTTNELVQVKSLKKYFPVEAGVFRKTVNYVKAVDDVSFTVKEGETLGLVGESGCGKSTAGRTILQLLRPTAGTVIYNGKDITVLKKHELRLMRRQMQMIFQDPYASLDPKMNVQDTVMEPLIIHNLYSSKQERRQHVEEILDKVGLKQEALERFPHEFSGGQRQRIGIARALVLGPKLIVADEPVSALDVSIQAQVINLLKDLREMMGLTYIFISHDLSVIRHISDRVAVMYLGKIVELASRDSIFEKPLHPYTLALMGSVPIADPDSKKERFVLEGDVASPVNVPSGCPFHPRCSKIKDVCNQQVPKLSEYTENHFVSCHLFS